MTIFNIDVDNNASNIVFLIFLKNFIKYNNKFIYFKKINFRF